MFCQFVIFAAVGGVNWVACLFFAIIDPVQPLFDSLGNVFSSRNRLGTLSRRVVLVKLHTRRRCMDDGGAPITGVMQNLVHPRCHFGSAADGIQAMVGIPHVANDHSRLSWIPLLVDVHRLQLAVGRFGLLAQRQSKVRSGGR